MMSTMMLAACLGQAADIAMERRASAEEKLYRVIDGKTDAKRSMASGAVTAAAIIAMNSMARGQASPAP